MALLIDSSIFFASGTLAVSSVISLPSDPTPLINLVTSTRTLALHKPASTSHHLRRSCAPATPPRFGIFGLSSGHYELFLGTLEFRSPEGEFQGPSTNRLKESLPGRKVCHQDSDFAFLSLFDRVHRLYRSPPDHGCVSMFA